MNKGHIQAERAEAIRRAFNPEPEPAPVPTLGPCHCRRGMERDNCPQCEGTGQRINFPLLRLRANVARASKEQGAAKWTPETGWTNDPAKKPS